MTPALFTCENPWLCLSPCFAQPVGLDSWLSRTLPPGQPAAGCSGTALPLLSWPAPVEWKLADAAVFRIGILGYLGNRALEYCPATTPTFSADQSWHQIPLEPYFIAIAGKGVRAMGISFKSRFSLSLRWGLQVCILTLLRGVSC